MSSTSATIPALKQTAREISDTIAAEGAAG